MSKTKGNKKRNSSKVKYILGSGVLILASTVILPKVLKKTTNYLYKKQVKITNRRKVNFDCKDKLVKKSDYNKGRR